MIPDLSTILVKATADWMVINKPEGFDVLTLSRFYQARTHFYPVHRLDKDTSGLWLIATHQEALASLSTLFEKRLITKHYIAIGMGRAKKKQGKIIGDMTRTRRSQWKLERSQNQPAETTFVSINMAPSQRLYWLSPKTGKTHQLRVAMKANGTPIAGDGIYAKQDCARFDRLYLHAHQLAFVWNDKSVSLSVMPKTGSLFTSETFSKHYQILQNKLARINQDQ